MYSLWKTLSGGCGRHGFSLQSRRPELKILLPAPPCLALEDFSKAVLRKAGKEGIACFWGPREQTQGRSKRMVQDIEHGVRAALDKRWASPGGLLTEQCQMRKQLRFSENICTSDSKVLPRPFCLSCWVLGLSWPLLYSYNSPCQVPTASPFFLVQGWPNCSCREPYWSFPTWAGAWQSKYLPILLTGVSERPLGSLGSPPHTFHKSHKLLWNWNGILLVLKQVRLSS